MFSLNLLVLGHLTLKVTSSRYFLFEGKNSTIIILRICNWFYDRRKLFLIQQIIANERIVCKYPSSFDIFRSFLFFFSLFCEKFSRKRGNSYSYSLRGELFALWSILLVGVIFLAEQKLHKRGRKIVKNRSKRVFVNDSRSLFLFGRYIYIFFFWYDLLFVTSGTRFLLEIRKYVFLFNIGVKWQKEKWERKKGEL